MLYIFENLFQKLVEGGDGPKSALQQCYIFEQPIYLFFKKIFLFLQREYIMLQTFTLFVSKNSKKGEVFSWYSLSSFIVPEGIQVFILMLQVFILIVTNHRKNDYYVIHHPNICKIFYNWFSMWHRIIGAQQQID